MARSTMSFNCGEMDGLTSTGGVGASFSCAFSTLYDVSAWNGLRPVSIS